MPEVKSRSESSSGATAVGARLRLGLGDGLAAREELAPCERAGGLPAQAHDRLERREILAREQRGIARAEELADA